MDIIEAVCTIIVTLMAVWGTLMAWENGFWHNLKHIVDHYHEKIEMEEAAVKHHLLLP